MNRRQHLIREEESGRVLFCMQEKNMIKLQVIDNVLTEIYYTKIIRELSNEKDNEKVLGSLLIYLPMKVLFVVQGFFAQDGMG